MSIYKIKDDDSRECFHCNSMNIDVTIYGGYWYSTECRDCGMYMGWNNEHTGLIFNTIQYPYNIDITIGNAPHEIEIEI